MNDNQPEETTVVAGPTISGTPENPPAGAGAVRIQAGPRYAELSILGRGGMGVVDLVRDELLERRVARKICLDDNPHALARFLREAQISSLLDHANIAPIYDAGRDALGRTYFTMKFIEGKPLSDLLRDWKTDAKARAAFPMRRRLTLMTRMLEGMAYAHARGVIHRDLKPANLIVGEFGELFVVDWGLAKRTGEADVDLAPVPSESDEDAGRTLAGSVVGTPGYLAPEQARGELDRVGRPSDVFSLGVILYELATGTRAFPGRDALLVVTAIAEGMRPAAEPLRAVSRGLAAVIERAMAVDPDDRYPDAARMLEDVEALLDERPPSVYRESLTERMRRLARRHTGALVACSAILLVVAATLGWVAQVSRQRADAEGARAQAETRRAEAEAKRSAAEYTRAEAQTQRAEAERAAAEEAQARLDAQAKLVALEQERTKRTAARLKALGPYSIAASRMARYIDFASLQQVVVPLLNEALAIDPSLMEAHLLLIRAYVTLQRPQQVATYMARMVAALPDNERKKLLPLGALIGMALLTGRPVGLPSDLEQSTSELIAPAQWKAFAASMLMVSNNNARALVLVDELLADPINEGWELQVFRGMLLVRLDRNDEARVLATEQLVRYPLLQPLLQLRAEASYRLHDHRAALGDLQVLLEHDPICDPAIDMLARIEHREARAAIQADQSVPIEMLMSAVRHYIEAGILGTIGATGRVRSTADELVRVLPGREKAGREVLLERETWAALAKLVAGLEADATGNRTLVLRAELAKLVACFHGTAAERLAGQLGCSADRLVALRQELRERYAERARGWLSDVLGAVPPSSLYGREAARGLELLTK